MRHSIALVFFAFVANAMALPRRPILPEERIVNGTDAPQGKYPSMVSLKFLGKHNCGGTILNEFWVLTAAHCIVDYEPNVYTVYAGSVDLLQGGTIHAAEVFVVHEKYDSSTIENDVGLVKVSTPFVWSENVAPVNLPGQGQDTPGGMNATVIGWGYPYSGGGTMIKLQEVDYWTVSDQECNDIHTREVFPTNICAFYPGGGKGQCSGDSGGPLWVEGQQVGIVSWSIKPCAVAPYPGVFTEVSAYIDWINININ